MLFIIMPISDYLQFATDTSTFCYKVFQKMQENQNNNKIKT